MPQEERNIINTLKETTSEIDLVFAEPIILICVT